MFLFTWSVKCAVKCAGGRAACSRTTTQGRGATLDPPPASRSPVRASGKPRANERHEEPSTRAHARLRPLLRPPASPAHRRHARRRSGDCPSEVFFSRARKVNEVPYEGLTIRRKSISIYPRNRSNRKAPRAHVRPSRPRSRIPPPPSPQPHPHPLSSHPVVQPYPVAVPRRTLVHHTSTSSLERFTRALPRPLRPRSPHPQRSPRRTRPSRPPESSRGCVEARLRPAISEI